MIFPFDINLSQVDFLDDLRIEFKILHVNEVDDDKYPTTRRYNDGVKTYAMVIFSTRPGDANTSDVFFACPIQA